MWMSLLSRLCDMKKPLGEIFIPLIPINKDTLHFFKSWLFHKCFLFFFSTSEIPQFRLPYDVVNFEIELMKDLGVKVSEKLSTYMCIAPKERNKLSTKD